MVKIFLVIFASVTFPDGGALSKGETISETDLAKRFPDGTAEAGIDRLIRIGAIEHDPLASLAAHEESASGAGTDDEGPSLDRPDDLDGFTVKELAAFAQGLGLEATPTKKADLVAFLRVEAEKFLAQQRSQE